MSGLQISLPASVHRASAAHGGVRKVSVVTTFSVASTVTLSLAPVKPFGYPVTVALLMMTAYAVFAAQRLQRSALVAYLLLLLYFCGNALLQASTLNGIEFLRTFGLVVISAFVFISAFGPDARAIPYVDCRRIISVSAVLIVGFEFLQLFESLVLGSSSLWFILDPISISTADDVGRFEAVNLLGFFRPISFFHEPSYLAAVLFVMFAAASHVEGRPKWLRPLLICGLLLTLSATLIFFLLLYVAIGFAARRPVTSIVLAAVLVLSASGAWITIYELSRIGEIGLEGSSGWTRLVLPLQKFLENLLAYPAGLPLGQSEFIFDNSAYLLMSYFGVFFPPLFVAVLAMVRRRLPDWPTTLRYYTILLSLLFLNGAVLTVETGWLLLILNLSFFGMRGRYRSGDAQFSGRLPPARRRVTRRRPSEQLERLDNREDAA